MKLHPITALFALLLCQAAQSQDSLFYTNGQRIAGRVEEVGLDVVRYRTSSGESLVLIVVPKKDLARIKLQSGQVFEFAPGYYDEEVASAEFLARTHKIAFDFIAPALNHVVIGYEQVLRKRMNLEVKAGYIGIGNYGTNFRTQHNSGVMAKVGIKYIMPISRRRIPNARDVHPLSGWYLKPELMISGWSSIEQNYNYYYPLTAIRNDYVSAALNMTVGRQVILGERFTFDLFCGFGYGAQWKNGRETSGLGNIYTYDRQEYSYSHAFLGSRVPLTTSGGLMFGYIF